MKGALRFNRYKGKKEEPKDSKDEKGKDRKMKKGGEPFGS